MANKISILLDIDGVLVTTPAWRPTPIHEDGFMEFNPIAAKNLARLIERTGATIVLASTHRISYTPEQWIKFFRNRGIVCAGIQKLNKATAIEHITDRATELNEWVANNGNQSYIIIDDDLSIHRLPEHIQARWIKTNPLIGFNDECLERALRLVV